MWKSLLSLIAERGKMLRFIFAVHDFLYLYTHTFFSVKLSNFHFNSFSANPAKWSITLKQFVGNLPINFQIKQFIIFENFSCNYGLI